MVLKRGKVSQFSTALFVRSQDLKGNMFRRREEYSGVLSGMPGGSTA
jgi:hypothetical protein